MNLKREIAFIPILFYLLLFASAISAAENNPVKWSFNFSSLSVDKTLDYISNETGITITANIPENGKVINGTYENVTLDNMISDIFRDQNYAVIWYYKDNKIESIKIWSKENRSIGKGESVKKYPLASHRTSKPVSTEPINNKKVQNKRSDKNKSDNSLATVPKKWRHLTPPPVPPLRNQ